MIFALPLQHFAIHQNFLKNVMLSRNITFDFLKTTLNFLPAKLQLLLLILFQSFSRIHFSHAIPHKSIVWLNILKSQIAS